MFCFFPGSAACRAPVFALLMTLCVQALPAQVRLLLEVRPQDRQVFREVADGLGMPYTLEPVPGPAVFRPATKAGVDSICVQLIHHYRSKGCLAVSIDSLYSTGDTLFRARFVPGPAMRWISLRLAHTSDMPWAEAAGFSDGFLDGKPFWFEDVLLLEKGLLEEAENNGYPFASIRLDSLEIHEDGGVSAVLQIDRSRYFAIRELKVHGNLKLPRYYLPNYLGLRPGAPYSRARVLRLREQLQTLLFLEPTANPTVSFTNEGATINLFLQKKRASRFDFIIGILPQPDNAASSVLLTGTLSAAFQNALNLGERLSVELERLKPETQKLDVQTGVPYLFGTVFGVDGRLGIFKRDSTWVDAQSELGVQYLFPGANFFRVLWENKSASLQKIDTQTIRLTRKLPPNLDFRQNGFGIEASFSKLDYRFNPRRGWTFSVKTVAGFSNVLRNSRIEALSDPADSSFLFSTLYDGVAQRSTRYRVETTGAVYFPVFARSTIKFGWRGGSIFSNKPVYANEQYRIGGNKLLRGFDEESLQATRFVVLTGEWRLLIGQNSFLAAFSDWSYLENLTDRNRSFLRPLGFGAGLNFETKAGIFGINVAVGRRDPGQAINLRAAKFHLGYVSLF